MGAREIFILVISIAFVVLFGGFIYSELSLRAFEEIFGIHHYYKRRGVDLDHITWVNYKFEDELCKYARWHGKKTALFYAYKIGYAEAKLEEIKHNEEK